MNLKFGKGAPREIGSGVRSPEKGVVENLRVLTGAQALYTVLFSGLRIQDSGLRLARNHDGVIWLVSEWRKRSTRSARLPLPM